MQKTFTDAYIRKLNEICADNTECRKQCDCIGWCKQVFCMANDKCDNSCNDGGWCAYVLEKAGKHERTR